MFKDKLTKKDIKAIVLFSIAWPIATIRKKKHPDLWLVSERPEEARDNGYWLYKYIKKNAPSQDAAYVIAANAEDKLKIEKYGNIISFATLEHYIVYLMASKHVSAHVDLDSPNSRVSNFLETHGLLKNKRVFLQHGITKDKISFGYYSISRADLFVCAAQPEYEFCKAEFGYPEGTVQLLGFARFDGLGVEKPKHQILLMPTWRAWLANADEKEFKKSRYFQVYQNLLYNEEIETLLEDNELELIFYPHSDMQKFVHLFSVKCKKIIVSDAGRFDVQQLLNQSRMLITDYSSVAFDMAYMNKPIIYYQFDYDDYRNGQHSEGYFSYENDGFGPICREEEAVIAEIKKYVCNNFVTDNKYAVRQNTFFSIRDQNNCKRIYQAIREL